MRRRRRPQVHVRRLAALAVCLPLAGGAVAEEDETLFGAGLADAVELEIELEVNTAYEGNIDLNDDEDDAIGVTEAEISAALVYAPSDSFSAELGLVLGHEFFFVDEPGEEDPEPALEVDKALLTFSDVFVDGLEIQLGRQKFRDEERKFLFDETLDGVRFFYQTGPFLINASAGRQRVVDQDLLNVEDKPRVNYYALDAAYSLSPSVRVGGIVFHTDDRSGEGGELTTFSLRSFGSSGEGWRYWADFSHVRGDDGESDVSGFAVDTALSYVFDLPFEPSVALGYAWGSGDDDPDDDVDRTYRQSGLQANEAIFNGVADFKYLGEVFDPELSNLHVFTAGLGARWEFGSVDIVWHHYRLDEAAEELGDARIEADLRDPLGSRVLGNEVDLIIGLEDIAGVPDLSADFVAGYFWPGDAFAAENDDDAFFFRLDLSISF